MDENTIKQILRSDARVKELIDNKAQEYYLQRDPQTHSAQDDWLRAEKDILDEVTSKFLEAQAEAWTDMTNKNPEFKEAYEFATLVGFMLAVGGQPQRGQLYDTRYYTIGLSYITGMFKVGQTIDSEAFTSIFSNDDNLVAALKYYIQTDANSPYSPDNLDEPISNIFADDARTQEYIAYAEKQIRSLFALFKKMLLGS